MQTIFKFVNEQYAIFPTITSEFRINFAIQVPRALLECSLREMLRIICCIVSCACYSSAYAHPQYKHGTGAHEGNTVKIASIVASR